MSSANIRRRGRKCSRSLCVFFQLQRKRLHSYTHLTQIFLTFWVYSLPLCLIPLYSYATVLIMPLVTFVLFGMDAVAREIQDPFGFDENLSAAAPFAPSFKFQRSGMRRI